jgi:hypothetical protein
MYDPIEDTMKVLHINNKGLHMNVLERFHIYEATKREIQLNDILTGAKNLFLAL